MDKSPIDKKKRQELYEECSRLSKEIKAKMESGESCYKAESISVVIGGVECKGFSDDVVVTNEGGWGRRFLRGLFRHARSN